MKIRDLILILPLALLAPGCASRAGHNADAPAQPQSISMDGTAAKPEEKAIKTGAAPVGSAPVGMDSSQYPAGATDSPH